MDWRRGAATSRSTQEARRESAKRPQYAIRAERRPMLPTAVRHASHAHAAQQDARHDAAHMVATLLFSGGDQVESIGKDGARATLLGSIWGICGGTRVGEGTSR